MFLKNKIKLLSTFLAYSLLLAPIPYVIMGATTFPLVLLFLISNFILLLIKSNFRFKYVPYNTYIKFFISILIITFFINSLSDIDAENNIRRIFSTFLYLIYFLSFFIGFYIFYDNSIKVIEYIKVIIILYLIFNFFWFIKLISQSDLLAARESFGQRMPAIISFFATVSLYLFLTEKKLRTIYILNFILGFSIVILSLTRAAYIQTFASIALIFLTRVNRKVLFLLLIFTIILYITWNLLPTDNQIHERFTLLLDLDAQSNETSGGFRLHYWTKLINILVTNPFHLLFGYGGLGADFVGKESSAHSEYIDHFVRYGLIGLITYLTIMLNFAYKMIRSKINENTIKNYFNGFAFSLIGLLFFGIFHESTKYQLLGIIIWFNLGIFASIQKTDAIKLYNEK